MNRPSYKELWLDEVKSNAEELERVRDAVDGNAEVYTDEPYSEGEYLARKIMQMHSRIAELEAMVEKLNGWIDELINAGNQPRHRNWQDNWDAIVYRIIKEREK